MDQRGRLERLSGAVVVELSGREEAEFEARPSRRCGMCGEWKREFKASGGCMDCPVPPL